jgi:hypothetical protein
MMYTRTLTVARLSVVILARAMTTPSDTSLENFESNFLSLLSYTVLSTQEKVMIVTGLRRSPSSSVSHRSLLHDAPWWMAGFE